MAETSNSLQSKRVQVPDSPRAIQDYCWEQGWTDGLPIVPPTEPLVREMLDAYGGAPSGSLGRIQPGNSNVTLEKLAVNAVMAGCLPEHFPVVVAAVKAALRDEFNLAGNAVTTGGAAQVLIVNGPIAKNWRSTATPPVSVRASGPTPPSAGPCGWSYGTWAG